MSPLAETLRSWLRPSGLGRTPTILRSPSAVVRVWSLSESSSWPAGTSAVDGPRAAGVLALDRQDVARDDHAPVGVDLAVVEDDAADPAGVELQQVRLDPVGEPGREVDLDVHAVGPLLAGHADVALARCSRLRTSLPMMKSARTFSDLSRSVTRLPRPFRRGRLVVERVDDAHLLLVLDAVGADRVLGQVDDARRRLGQAVLGVGRVVVVRGDHPLAILELDLEPRRPWRSRGRSR